MEFLINPTVAYLLIVTIAMLLLLTINDKKITVSNYGMILCLVAAGYELVYLEINPWAFLVVALSPLPFRLAIRQTPMPLSLVAIAILMLALGSFYLFLDENGAPVVNYSLAGFVSTICGAVIWITIDRMRNAEGIRLNNNPDSVIGLIGEARTDIETHSAGSVLVEGELWQACSKQPILAGSTVRVLSQIGFWLTVKEVEKLIQK